MCREIRREHGPGELPVIMITCSSLEEDVIKGLAVGANDYMIKPLRHMELMARIKTQLALKRSIKVGLQACLEKRYRMHWGGGLESWGVGSWEVKAWRGCVGLGGLAARAHDYTGYTAPSPLT